MKLLEIKDLAGYNEFDRKGKEMDYPNVFKVKYIGGKTKVKPRTVVVRDKSTGKVYGRRTIHTKV